MDATYRYPVSGRYNETEATLSDGRVVVINTQYGRVDVIGEHAATCGQLTQIGGHCTCGLLDGIDIAALVADAREHGLFGAPQRGECEPMDEAGTIPGTCPRCGSVCYGDCD